MASSDKPKSLLLCVAEGLQILAKYSGEYDMCAEHDEIFAGPDAAPQLLPEERARLQVLGWREKKGEGFSISV